MYKKLLTIVMAAATLTAVGQSKLQPTARRIMQEYRLQQTEKAGLPVEGKYRSKRAAEAINNPMVNKMILVVEPGTTADDLEAAGCEVLSLKGTAAMVHCTLDNVDALAALDCVRGISFGDRQDFHMHIARGEMGVDLIHQGNESDDIQPYTGKNVLFGIIDTGFDPNHLNFLDEDGNSRFECFYNFISDDGTSVSYQGENLKDFKSDITGLMHATHTTGIAAGSYKGPADYYDPTQGGDMDQEPCPYYGAAYEADIVGCGGELYDANIASAINTLARYKKSNGNGRPMVVNMSFGSIHGPHDGTSPLCNYLGNFSDDLIMCMSAGNDGELPIAITKIFEQDGDVLRTILYPTTQDTHQCSFYSDDSTPFELDMVVVDTRGNILCSVPVNQDYEHIAIGTSRYEPGNGMFVEPAFDDTFYSGSVVTATANVDPLNNRYTVDIEYAMVAKNYSAYFGFVIKAPAGHRVDGNLEYNGGDKFTSYNIAGWQDGSTNGTISDLATTHGVISVGAYATNDEFWPYTGEIADYSGYFTKGDICYFSSYGDLVDGRSLPMVAAPGALIVSSTSRWSNVGWDGKPYLPNQDDIACTVSHNGLWNTWVRESGTSMASPAAAGAIALWLEANPDLTYDQVVEILEKTSKRDKYTDNEAKRNRWGFGKINAYDGLVMAKQLSSVIGTPAEADHDKDLMLKNLGGNVFETFVAGAEGITATVTSMAGANVLNAGSDCDTLTVDASTLTPGIYVLTVKANNLVRSTKFVVR